MKKLRTWHSPGPQLSTSSKVGPPSCKNNSLRHSNFFDKCCIFVKNNVYLQSLIYILLSHVLRANPSYEMAVRAHLHHGSLISETVLFAHLLVCSLSWMTSMERARSSLGRHVPDGWWSGERLVVFLALVGKWSRVSGIARRGLRGRSPEIPLATDNEYAMHSGRGDRDEGEPLARLGASSIIFFSRQSILIASKKCVCNTIAKDINYAIVRIPVTRPRDLYFRFWVHDLS